MKIKQEHKTILVLVTGFTIISLVFKLKALLYVSLAILLISIISNSAAKLIANSWMSIGKYIGAINSKIILSVFYILILVPMATLKKVFEAKTKIKAKTNWVNVDENERNNFNNPW